MAQSIMSTVSQMDREICHKASRYSVRVAEEMSKRSSLISDVDDVVPSFERDEIIPFLGDLLGKGGFNNVYELDRIELSTTSPNPAVERLRNRLANSREKLAVKFLCEEAMNNADEFCNGAADLLMEAKYLSALARHPHPGLIQLYGVCAEGAGGFSTGLKGGYFLVIDRLYDTLDRRIDVWREVRRRRSKDISSTTNRKLLKALYFQRVMVAYDIAQALKHLHKLQIVFRDLKPDNVGFGYNNCVKLFDFGLAKELDPYQKLDNGLYKMSGGTGSRRFSKCMYLQISVFLLLCLIFRSFPNSQLTIISLNFMAYPQWPLKYLSLNRTV